MSDSLNFGPEWIRNLSSDGNISSSGGGTKYQLADYRYGREEMLALFEKGLKAPEPLPSFPSLFMEHTQVPLALIPMTEDENRLWQSRPAPPIATRGRGGSLERGRGRGRGTTFHQFRSSSGFDEPIRSYERQQSGWQERNGGVADGPEWAGVGSSPRKELGNRSIGSSGMDWRRHRMEEESDGWRNNSSNHRPDKWNRGSLLSNSWREGDPGEERYERTIVTERPARTSWHSGDGAHLSRTRRPWEVTSEDHLPEWATENLHESGGSGSFDSSGAFHGNSAEDEHGQRGVQKSASQHNIPQSTRAHTLHTSQSAHTLSIKAITEKSESPQPSDRGEQTPVRMPLKKVASPSPPIERKPSPPETPKQKEKEKVDVKSNNIGNDATNGNKSEVKPVKNKPREESVEKIKKLPMQENSMDKERKVQKQEPPPTPEKKQTSHNTNGLTNSKPQPVNEEVTFVKKNEDEFDRMQEVADDLVAKLMLDEEAPNSKNSFNLNSLQRSIENDMKTQSTFNLQSNLLPNSLLGSQQPPPPPPNLNAGQEKWYYRDPQGDVQGPFLASDMTEWYRAGYFSVTLLLKRQCDERFFTLGELVKLCGNAGTAPFAKTLRLPPVKTNPEPTSMMSGVQTPAKPAAQPGLDTDALHRLQQMQLQQSLQQQILIRQAMALQTLSQTEPSFAGLSALQQRELVAQHILSQPPIMPESPFINHSIAAPNIQPNHPITPSNIQPNNPLMQMINQMQQANKLPPQSTINETKLPNSIPSQKLDPIQQLIQQMGGMQQPHSTTPSGIPPPGSQHPMGMPGPPSGMEHLNHQHPNSLPDDPIKNFLRQFSNHQQQQPQPQQPPQQQPVDSFWSQGSFPNTNQQPSWLTNPSPTPNNTANTQPVSMWGNDVLANLPQQQRPIPQQPPQPDTPTPMTNVAAPKENQKRQQEPQQKEVTVNQKKGDEEKEKLTKKKQEEDKKKRELAEKEKKRKDQELEKIKAKDAEEKRKEDLKKQELERKATEERNKKELERLKKNMEKAKKEAEEKRQRELEEKRRLKEQRKAEEEARKKQEDDKKKAVDDEKKKEQDRKAQEDQSRRQQEALRKMQETQQQQRARVAPWYQAGGPGGNVPGAPGAATKTMTLTEIQKAEKERRTAELALQQQQAKAQAIKEAQEMQIAAEKSQMQLKWASKVAAMPKKVKSLAEIQAEEQERLAKQAAEARLAQLKDKKESASPVQSVGIWESASQSLTWGQNAGAGFWDDVLQQTKPIQKPSGVTKSASAISINQNSNKNQTQNKINTPTSKTKTKPGKQEQSNVLKLFDSNGMELGIEFSSWCTKALGALNSDVDIPTFIGFLMEIESPYEIKDYVRTYLGEGNASNDFARQFLERRSKAKQRNRAALQQTDDMCVPAPAVNPSNITSEFQEVKGKAKKVKKSKMMKIDARILGFSVTAAQDRINVGDRDYGDNA